MNKLDNVTCGALGGNMHVDDAALAGSLTFMERQN